jgi:diphthine-ammonia ligase
VSVAVVWSGGKDSTLALDRALARGLDVTTLINFFDEASGRIRFHGVRRELIAAQAEALRLDVIQRATTMQNFEAAFAGTMREVRGLDIDTVVFGNIHLADVRAWYEERTTAAGLNHVEPLWDTPPARVVGEVIDRGYRAVLTGIDTTRVPRAWLGRSLDRALLRELQAAAGIDAAGESGEYHTFVYDGPTFRQAVRVTNGAVHETETHAQLDLQLS